MKNKANGIFRSRTTLLLLLTAAALLSGCWISHSRYDKTGEKDLVSAELLKGRDGHGVSGHFDPDAYELLRTLEGEKLENFLSELKNIEFTDAVILLPITTDPSFCYGVYVVRLRWADGRTQCISCEGYGESFDASGNVEKANHYGCDRETWHAFFEKYASVSGSQSLPDGQSG
ncbi:MAG: hypothetical protein J5843_02500 [Clostridia bacterium]|nr:hypothetical protein [Clostridia bacterium]